MISKQHAKKLRDESGIRLETALAAGLFTVDENKARDLIGHKVAGIAFPYIDLAGETLGHRVKLDIPLKDGGKYLQRKEQDLHFFFKKEDLEKLKDLNTTLYITEGEKKALALSQILNEGTVLATPGCWNWKKSDSKELPEAWASLPLEKRNIVFIPDSDFFINSNVWDAGEALIKALLKKGANVNLVSLSKDEKMGVDDFILKFGKENLLKKIKAPLWRFENLKPEDLPRHVSGVSGDLESILECLVLTPDTLKDLVLTELKNSTGITKAVLQKELQKKCSEWKKNKPEKRKNQNYIMWIKDQEFPEEVFPKIGNVISNNENCFIEHDSKKLVFIEGQITRRFKSGADFATWAADRINFKTAKSSPKGGLVGECGIMPVFLGTTFLENLELYTNLRPLKQHALSPSLIGTTIISKKGYYENEHVLYSGPELTPSFSLEHTLKALDYPFEDDTHKVNALGCLVGTVFCRGDYPGTHPMLLIKGDDVDLGKSKLAETFSYIATGKLSGSASYKKNDEALEKEMGAHAENNDFLCFDNIRAEGATIGSSTLERSITNPVLNFRLLGKSGLITRRNDMQFMATINEGAFTRDMITRSVLISLSSKNKRDDISVLEYAQEHREDILKELLGLVVNWKKKGCNYIPVKFPKFPRWGSLINGILTANGINGFLSNHEESASKLDAFTLALVEAAREELGDKEYTREYAPSYWREKVELTGGRQLFKDYPSSRAKDTLIGGYLRRMNNREFSFMEEETKVTITVNAKKNLKRGGTALDFWFSLVLVSEPSGPLGTPPDKFQPSDNTEISEPSEHSGPILDILPKSSTLDSTDGGNGSNFTGCKINNTKKVPKVPKSIIIKEEDTIIKEEIIGTSIKNIGSERFRRFSNEEPYPISLNVDERWEESNNKYNYLYEFKGKKYTSKLWDGQLLVAPTFSYDLETSVNPNGIPKTIVLAGACDGTNVFFILPKDLKRFFEINTGKFAAHFAAFELYHTSQLFDDPSWMFHKVESVRDTYTLSRLLSLGLNGSAHSKDHGLGKSVKEHLGLNLPKEVTFNGKEVRTTYSDYADDLDNIPAAYLHYLAFDAISTLALESIVTPLIAAISPVKEKEQGYDLQLKESLTAYIMTQSGCRLDKDLVDEYSVKWDALTEQYLEEVKAFGFVPGSKGNQKELQRILGNIKKEHSLPLLRSVSKKGIEGYSTKTDHLKDYINVPFIESYIRHKKANKISNDFLKRLSNQDRIHTKYTTLMTTGRWSSAPNIQNIPRPTKEIDLRKVFIAKPGFKLIAADYAGAELSTLAVTLRTLFPHRKQHLCEAIKNRVDLHKLVASKFYGIAADQITKEQRLLGKIANFGFGGGLTPRSMVANCKEKFDLVITLEESENLKKAWLDSFPELYDFFALADRAEEALILESYPSTSMPKGAAFQVMRSIVSGRSHTRAGREFTEKETQWAWSNTTTLLAKYPKLNKFKTQILSNIPSPDLAKDLSSLLVNDLPLNHRRRANCTKNNFLNTFFQGLAADIIYEAAYELTKDYLISGSESRIVNAIHDELVFEVRAEDVEKEKTNIASVMTWAAKKYCDDVPMAVEFTVGDHWTK